MISSTIFVIGRFPFFTTRFFTPSMTKLELLFTNELNMLDISLELALSTLGPWDKFDELEILDRDFHRCRYFRAAKSHPDD